MERENGYYFGTEISGKWYRRYMKSGMLARGNGDYWFDENGLNFLRMLTSKPMVIPFSAMQGIQTGKWHSGRWGQGCTVIKVLWSDNNQELSSGFILAKNKTEEKEILDFLEKKISDKQ